MLILIYQILQFRGFQFSLLLLSFSEPLRFLLDIFFDLVGVSELFLFSIYRCFCIPKVPLDCFWVHLECFLVPHCFGMGLNCLSYLLAVVDKKPILSVVRLLDAVSMPFVLQTVKFNHAYLKAAPATERGTLV